METSHSLTVQSELRVAICRRHAKEWDAWKSATCVLIESMEEKAAYIHGGQGAKQGC
jgi:hypothetical protein